MTVRKSLFAIAVLIFGMLSLGCAAVADSGKTAEDTEYPYDYTDPASLSEPSIYRHIPQALLSGVKGEKTMRDCFVLDVDLEPETQYWQQGGCTDGKYVYFAMNADKGVKGVNENVALTQIYKVDMIDWEVKQVSEYLELGHANSMCYNEKKDQIVVVHLSRSASSSISYVDPDTLEVTHSTLPWPLVAIAYNAKTDRYVLQNSNKDEIIITDGDFNFLDSFNIHRVSGNQDIDCDDQYIYVAQCKPKIRNVILIYNWDGEYLGIFRPNSDMEMEFLCNADGVHYLTFAAYRNGAFLYEIDYNMAMLDYEAVLSRSQKEQ